ncbi:hypothetical protein EON83_02955 [bacterium]|nr:MAG: hypothetical protein EON83_02955 [bacterium]
MALWKDKYRIETTRKTGRDYSEAGWYFVTICERDKSPVFGTLVEGTVELSPLGELVARCWQQVPSDFDDVVLDEWIIMPDHFHALIWLDGSSLSQIINGFKGRVTRLNRQEDLGDFTWQSRFHDRIIRTQKELDAARHYIITNPERLKDTP